jgi:hypothetical protein
MNKVYRVLDLILKICILAALAASIFGYVVLALITGGLL